jgi:hypothetical protein
MLGHMFEGLPSRSLIHNSDLSLPAGTDALDPSYMPPMFSVALFDLGIPNLVTEI